jgi:hypothetical protein
MQIAAPCPELEYRMQKSTLIAKCLLNSSMVTSLDIGESIVRDPSQSSSRSKSSWKLWK